jgi:hypothetical protein
MHNIELIVLARVMHVMAGVTWAGATERDVAWAFSKTK